MASLIQKILSPLPQKDRTLNKDLQTALLRVRQPGDYRYAWLECSIYFIRWSTA